MTRFPLWIIGALMCKIERGIPDDLIVTLPAIRVLELIDNAEGKAFAPAGRRFKEWVSIPGCDSRLWNRLLREARALVRSRTRI